MIKYPLTNHAIQVALASGSIVGPELTWLDHPINRVLALIGSAIVLLIAMAGGFAYGMLMP